MTRIEPFCWSQILEGTYQVLWPDIDQNGFSWDCIQMNEHGYIQLNKNSYGNLCDEVQNEWLKCSFMGSVNNNAKERNNIRWCPAIESNVDTPQVLLYFNKLNAGLELFWDEPEVSFQHGLEKCYESPSHPTKALIPMEFQPLHTAFWESIGAVDHWQLQMADGTQTPSAR